MRTLSAKTLIQQLLQEAHITINGNQPYDIQIHNDKFYSRVVRDGSLGLGESYMDGWWDAEKVDAFLERLLSAQLDTKIKTSKLLLLKLAFAKFVNWQSKSRAFIVGQKHYDLGNLLFQCMLDSRMTYTCAYWHYADNLDYAQRNKLELTCQKLYLKPGMRVLDIGCGWGSFARYVAENFGVSVVGVTVSKNQYQYAKENCKHLPVEIYLQDYRDIKGKFDRIVSLGMFEHVGHLNYRTFMNVVRRSLTDEGIFLLHTIGSNLTTLKGDEWVSKYIFPNGMLPSIPQIGTASEGLFVMEDWHNFGADYAKTLAAWHHNFNAHWESLKHLYDERFFRMWNYFLLSSKACFETRVTQLWQIVFSKLGIPGGYQAVRPYFQADKASPDSANNLNKSLL